MSGNKKILHISAANPSTGAGKAALALHSALLDQNLDSRILFLNAHPDKSNEIFVFTDSILKRIIRFIVTTFDRIPTWFYVKREKQIFSPGIFGLSLLTHPLIEWADIIHLHWVNHGFVKISELKKLNKSIVWTMHDMWVLTGGCHHSFLCTRFTSTCGKCPMLGSSTNKDLSYWVLKNKQETIPVNRIKWIAISSWMSDLAHSSTLLKNEPVHIIFSGIDTRIFKPQDKDASRIEFGFPLDKTIILLGADNLFSAYKGVQYSLDTLKLLDPQYIVVTFGNGALDQNDLSQTVINLGFICDSQKLASLYSSADLFLATSIAEAFGMTIAEAQCCGTPAVAFNSIGPKDIIEHKVTGYLAEMRSIPDLLEGVTFCLSHKLDNQATSQRAVNLFSIESCARKYIELYDLSFHKN